MNVNMILVCFALCGFDTFGMLSVSARLVMKEAAAHRFFMPIRIESKTISSSMPRFASNDASPIEQFFNVQKKLRTYENLRSLSDVAFHGSIFFFGSTISTSYILHEIPLVHPLTAGLIAGVGLLSQHVIEAAADKAKPRLEREYVRCLNQLIKKENPTP